MTLTAVAAWLNNSFAGFDQGITLAVHKLYESFDSWMTPMMEFVSMLGKGGVFLIILSLFLLINSPTRRYGTAMAISLAIGAIVVNLWLKVVIARPRPYADPNGFYYPLWQMLGSHIESDFSFPSGHTNAALAAIVPIFLLGRKNWSWLVIPFGILMGISRIYLVVHYPSDIIGGIITGSIAAIIGTLITLRIPMRSAWYAWALQKLKRKGAHE